MVVSDIVSMFDKNYSVSRCLLTSQVVVRRMEADARLSAE